MEQIRINRGIEIGVNDNGDSIFVDAENTLWVKNFRNLIDRVNVIVEEVGRIGSENMTEDEQLDVVIDKMKAIMDIVDEQFGHNTCKKVFGDIVPSPIAMAEFFEQLVPIIEKYANARTNKINTKYSTARKGGKK